MLLSIGMIVKNEEKYLEKCLTALKPILENVDSELIIADTGSTDNTVEIAKKFTDNVFHFEWINDFAAARNSTIDRAKGEWYMFLDADEIVTDCTELIEFFNSGEYKQYGTGTIIIKNYNDLSQMDVFNSYNLRRLTVLRDGVRFDKPIHESLDHFFPPIKNFRTAVDHYGYVYKENGKVDNDFIEKKTTRNLDLLFEELEEGKKNGVIKETIYGQIADCYIWRDECDSALEYVNLGMDNCAPKSLTRIEYINKKLKILGRLRKYDEIIDLCKWYFSKDNEARDGKLVTDSGIYFFWAVACFAKRDYNEVINKSVLGFDIYRNYLNGKLFTPELNFCGVETTIPMLKQLCVRFVVACNNMKKFDIAAREIDLIPIKDFFADMGYMKTYLSVRTELMEYTNYNKLPDLYYQLDKPNRSQFINILIRNIFRTEKHEHFLKKLSLIAGEDERLADVIRIYESYFINHNFRPAAAAEFIKKHGAGDNETVLLLMLKSNYDIAPFLCTEDFDAKKCVINGFGDFKYLNSAAELFENYMTGKISENGIAKAAELFYYATLTATEKDLNTLKLILNYGRIGKQWAELDPDELNSETEAPEYISFAVTIGEIAELYRKKRYEEGIARLEELLGDVTKESSEDDPEPSAEGDKAKIVRRFLELVRAEETVNNKMLEKQNGNPVIAQLAEQIKQEIREMIDNWDLDGAEDALNQMAKMAPFDPDIEDIRDEINDRKINYMNYM